MADVEKKRFMSLIPGQELTEDNELNLPLLLIALFGATASFLMAVSFSSFVDSSVVAVGERTGNKVPLPLARLLAAFLVTGVSFGTLIALFKWESSITRKPIVDE